MRGRAAVVLRWRKSTDQERQQLKWLVYMVALPVLAGFAGLLGGYGESREEPS